MKDLQRRGEVRALGWWRQREGMWDRGVGDGDGEGG